MSIKQIGANSGANQDVLREQIIDVTAFELVDSKLKRVQTKERIHLLP